MAWLSAVLFSRHWSILFRGLLARLKALQVMLTASPVTRVSVPGCNGRLFRSRRQSGTSMD